MNRYKGSKLLSFVSVRNGTVGGGKGETVVSPFNQLSFTLDDFLKLQLRLTLLVILGDCEIGDFGNARIVDVIDGDVTTYYI